MMTDILAEILEHKRGEVEASRLVHPLEEVRAESKSASLPRNFYAAVAGVGTQADGRAGACLNLIAEIKRRSPSGGEIRPELDPATVARAYADTGAAALSVLTDAKYFGGSAADLVAAREAVALPVLRKDFVVDAYQVYESRALGADAVLLIAEALAPETLVRFGDLALELQMTVLVEVHSVESLTPLQAWLAQKAGDRVLLGINNRDLRRQRTDLEIFEAVAAHAPRDVPLVAESGIRTREDVLRMQRAGARALLVGESLLRRADTGAAVRALLGD